MAVQTRPPLETVVGHTIPRVFTPPNRDLSEPDATYGHAVIEFARDVLQTPLDPWQEWLVLHMGEYDEDNVTPRFERVVVQVPRQNGKTFLLRVLSLFWQYVEKWPEILGTHTSQTYAKEEMLNATAMAREIEELNEQIDKVLEGNNNIYALTTSGSRYRAAAANSRAGRGKSLDRVIIDELQKHTDWNTYNAAIPAMVARPYAQAVMVATGGEDKSIVLNSLRATAIEYIEFGSGDDTLGLFEWSAAEYADITDPEVWATANPQLGHRLSLRKFKSRALMATTGPVEEANFRTEYLCTQVRSMNAAVDPAKWENSHVPGDLRDYKDRLTMAIDVSINRLHATLMMAAVQEDGKVRVEFIREWEGADILKKVSNDLPALIDKYKPKVFGWFPGGPSASLATVLRKRRGRWPGLVIEEIKGEVADACEGFSAEVSSNQVVHNNNPLVNAHVLGAEKLMQGDKWRFTRKGKGHADAAYAAAGAVFLARTLPPPPDVTMWSYTPKERS